MLILFSALWAFGGKSLVKIGSQGLDVQYAHVTHFQIPLADIKSLQIVDHPWYYGLGIRCVQKGTYALVTDTKGVVEFVFRKPVSIKINLFPATLLAKGLRLSIEDAERFVREVRERLRATNGDI